MTPTDWKNPELAKRRLFTSPRDSDGTRRPCVITAITMTIILIKARVDAFANYSFISSYTDELTAQGGGSQTFAMSLYRDSGYETPRTKMAITARLSVKSQRKGISLREGIKALMT